MINITFKCQEKTYVKKIHNFHHYSTWFLAPLIVFTPILKSILQCCVIWLKEVGSFIWENLSLGGTTRNITPQIFLTHPTLGQ